MSDKLDSGWAWLIVFVFFMALRGCNGNDDNEKKIDDLQQQVESLEQDVRSISK